MNNLEPRAKIGDVVYVRQSWGTSYRKCRVKRSRESGFKDDPVVWEAITLDYRKKQVDFFNSSILKNLTTNTVYE